jgi:hypothetical protein
MAVPKRGRHGTPSLALSDYPVNLKFMFLFCSNVKECLLAVNGSIPQHQVTGSFDAPVR